jgi:hypothetical protein
VGQGRRSLHCEPSITASPLRQRAEAVKADPELVRGRREAVALTAEHAVARLWPIDRPIEPQASTMVGGSLRGSLADPTSMHHAPN